MKDRTASSEVPGWYIELQANVLRQLPRPGEIDSTIAMGWNQNQKSLRKILVEALLPGKENQFSNGPQIFLAYWPIGCENKYEELFSTEESEFLKPFDILLPIGSKISFLTSERVGVDLKVVRYIFDADWNKLLIVVEVDEDCEAGPKQFYEYMINNWE